MTPSPVHASSIVKNTTPTNPQPDDLPCSPGSAPPLGLLSGPAGGFVVFAIPFLLAFPLPFDLNLYAGELLAIGLTPLVIRCRHWTLSSHAVRLILSSGLVWLVALMIADVWRQTSARNITRGWGEIALTLVMFVVLYTVVDSNAARLRMALLGLVAGYAVRLIFVPSGLAAASPWSHGGAWSAVILTLIVLPRLPRPFRRLSPEILMTGLAVFFVYQNARNAAGATVLAAVILGVIRISGFHRPVSFESRKVALSALAVAAAAGLVLAAYSQAASSGVLGASAAEQYRAQNSGSLGVLVGGRQDNVESLVAIADSPILGHGSHPPSRGISSTADEILRSYGYTPWVSEIDEIASHSFVLGAWVTAGAASLFFWFVVFRVTLRALGAAPVLDAPWMAITVFLSIGMFWNMLFSPFGGLSRTVVPIILITLLFAAESAQAEGVRPELLDA